MAGEAWMTRKSGSRQTNVLPSAAKAALTPCQTARVSISRWRSLSIVPPTGGRSSLTGATACSDYSPGFLPRNAIACLRRVKETLAVTRANCLQRLAVTGLHPRPLDGTGRARVPE